MTEITSKLSTALADRYKIERHLGEGGMATVYLAEDLKHKRKVAVKVLRPELAAVLGAERFVQEIKTTANLKHPHILPLHDSGDAEGFLYYVMPFIDGETLRDKLNCETQLGIDEAVKIGTDVADALHYAHGENVIHRDIKPENILLHNGRPMVADFGIALAVSAAAGGRMTETGLSLGTPHYMSPEQATAEKELTNRSDIYSLGSVLYEMLTGEPPHTGGSAQAIIMKIVTRTCGPGHEDQEVCPAACRRRHGVVVGEAGCGSVRERSEIRGGIGQLRLGVQQWHDDAGDACVLSGNTEPHRHRVCRIVRRTCAPSWADRAAATRRRRFQRWRCPLPAGRQSEVPNQYWQHTTVRHLERRWTIVFAADTGNGMHLWIRTLANPTPRMLEGTDRATQPAISPDGGTRR